MHVCFLLALIAAADIEPLTDAQRTALETAYDGRDHREEALFALVENVESWSVNHGDLGLAGVIDPQALKADPESSRGDLFRISGRLEQIYPLADPYDAAVECFVRISTGEPVLVYVPQHAVDSNWRPGDSVNFIVRFYKRVDDVARDGVSRSYAAFVGVPFDQPTQSNPAAIGLPILIGLIVLAAFLVIIVRRRIAQNQGRISKPSRSFEDTEVDAADVLPDDSAAALAELQRRADGR